MAFFFLRLLIFISILQPGVLWPQMDSFRPFFSIALVTAVLTIFYAKKHQHPARSPIEFKLIIGFAAIEVISTLQYFWIPEIISAAMFWIKIVIIFFIIVYNVDSIKKVRAVLWTIVIALFFVCYISYDKYKNPPPVEIEIRPNETASAYAYRAFIEQLRAERVDRLAGYGMYSGANDFALLLTISFAFVFKLFELSNGILKKLFLFLFMMCIYYLVILTISRGGFLGVSLVTALCIYNTKKIPLLAQSKFFRTAMITIMFLGAFSIMIVKVAQRHDTDSMLGGDASASHRLDAWIAGAKMLVTNPFTGVGFKHFHLRSKEYGTPLRIQAHNTIVKVSGETGFIGIFCYLGFIFFAFKKLNFLQKFYTERNDIEIVLLTQAVLFGLVGFFFNTQLSVKEHEWLLYILLGLTVSIYRIYQKEFESNNPV